MVQFRYTILYVNDVETSIAFYEKAFHFKRKFITPGNEYGELLTGNTTLSFAAHQLAGSNLTHGYQKSDGSGQPFGMEIGFTTENVDETIESAIAAGAQLVEPSRLKPWGQVVAYLRDLDGFLIEICTPMA